LKNLGIGNKKSINFRSAFQKLGDMHIFYEVHRMVQDLQDLVSIAAYGRNSYNDPSVVALLPDFRNGNVELVLDAAFNAAHNATFAFERIIAVKIEGKRASTDNHILKSF
jgi:hypothetical protein